MEQYCITHSVDLIKSFANVVDEPRSTPRLLTFDEQTDIWNTIPNYTFPNGEMLWFWYVYILIIIKLLKDIKVDFPGCLYCAASRYQL